MTKQHSFTFYAPVPNNYHVDIQGLSDSDKINEVWSLAFVDCYCLE